MKLDQSRKSEFESSLEEKENTMIDVFNLLDRMNQCCPINCHCTIAAIDDTKNTIQLYWSYRDVKGQRLSIATELFIRWSENRIDLALKEVKEKIREQLTKVQS